MRIKPTLLLPLVLLFTACSALQPAEAANPTAASLPTPAAGITPAAVQPTTLPAGPSIQTPYVPFFLTVTIENTVLRAGPGPLFAARTVLAQGARVQVLGIAPGYEWVFVQNQFENTGWVFAGLLEPNPAITSAPLIQPAELQVLRGQVLDTLGQPVSGIQFAVIEGVGAIGTPPRVDAVTDANGIFYAFLPTTAKGTWTVSYTSVTCTSNRMGPNCECPNGNCGKSDPEITTVTLPTSELVTFAWR